MSTVNPAYESLTQEIHLLEHVNLHGRKTELRQLLKLLNLAKSGQFKASLVLGDAGIGKTALLSAFLEVVREGIYCRVITLNAGQFQSPEAFYVAFMDQCRQEANAILEDALIAVNMITQTLDIHWTRDDLDRAISLVKLQETVGGQESIRQEKLVKAIQSQVSLLKKLKFSVNESIHRLVDLIVNPWVLLASNLLNPTTVPMQDAIRLADTLRKRQNHHDPAEEEVSFARPQTDLTPLPPEPMEIEEPIEPDMSKPFTLAPETPPSLVAGTAGMVTESTALILPEQQDWDLDAMTDIERVSNPRPVSPPAAEPSGLADRIEPTVRPVRHPVLKSLLNVLNQINASIQNVDTALLLCVDDWDRIQDQAGGTGLREFFSELLAQLNDSRQMHLMIVTAARCEGESYTLGGALYNHFKTKLLLEPLGEQACRKILKSTLKTQGLDVEESVVQQVHRLSLGNPYWHRKAARYLSERALAGNYRFITADFFEKLSLTELKTLSDLMFTRLKMDFLDDEKSLYTVIAALLKQVGEGVFSFNRTVVEISTSQGLSDSYVASVMRALIRYDWLEWVEDDELETRPDHRPDKNRNRLCRVQGRPSFEYLFEKTKTIETDISTDEKLGYLKRIIPLSVLSGELDREKTLEVLALSEALNYPEIVPFLEETFMQALQDERAIVRVTALNNVALLDSPRSREILFQAVQDEDSMVREYATRNLALLAQKTTDPTLGNRIMETLMPIVDDESEAVRAQVYGTLSRYRWHRDVVHIFVKGVGDACNPVRVISVQNLAELAKSEEVDSPYIHGSLLDALNDRLPEVRRHACLGLQKYPTPETVSALVQVLQSDPDHNIRRIAAEVLSRSGDETALQALIQALRHQPDEDVKLAVVRAFGKRQGWQYESILIDALQSANAELMPVFTWGCIQALGQVANSERALSVLSEFRKLLTNTLLISSIDAARQKIKARMDDLRQMEKRLETATPEAVSVPAEYQNEVTLPEDEL